TGQMLQRIAADEPGVSGGPVQHVREGRTPQSGLMCCATGLVADLGGVGVMNRFLVGGLLAVLTAACSPISGTPGSAASPAGTPSTATGTRAGVPVQAAPQTGEEPGRTNGSPGVAEQAEQTVTPSAPQFVERTIPSGTTLTVRLTTAVASDT